MKDRDLITILIWIIKSSNKLYYVTKTYILIIIIIEVYKLNS